MSYHYNTNGNVHYVPAYIQPTNLSMGSFQTTPAAVAIVTDPIRPQQLYVHSTDDVDSGHLVSWTGQPSMFLRDGQKVEEFDDAHGHEYALSSVNETDNWHRTDVAGVVLETAASPSDTQYIQKGVHSSHPIINNNHILRLSTPGSCVLAWVIDEHENSLEGIFVQYINGNQQGEYVVRELGNKFFTIEPLYQSHATLQLEVDTLTARLDLLTGDN